MMPGTTNVTAPPSPSLSRPPHAATVEQVLQTLETEIPTGLTGSAAAERLSRHGRNVLAQEAAEPWWRKLARQFGDVLILILVAAALVSGLLGQWIDAAAILAIVVLNGILGFAQEGRAERALAALKQMSTPLARVVRDGRSQNLPAAELVPGDRIDLEPGDRIPADVRLVNTSGFRTDESALTGESIPADKDHRETLDAKAALGDRVNMAYMGTAVAAGTATAVVVATGMATEIGRIAGMIRQQPAEKTPLQLRLDELGRILIYLILVVVAVMFAVQVARGGDLVESLLLSVSLAVAAVPEGLSAVVTVALALGLQRMARRNALIRRLPSVETLGSVTVICSDKTGTLTHNELTVRKIEAGGLRFEVTGGGYAPVGEFRLEDREAASSETRTLAVDPRDHPDLLLALTAGAWCGHARIAPCRDGSNGWEAVGDPTEAALVVAAKKAGLEAVDRERHTVHEIPFSSERKAMSVVASPDGGPLFMYTKGAPEVVLEKCTAERFACRVRPLTDARRREILDAARSMAEQALRVLGMAYREAREDHKLGEKDLVFAGLVGMLDPPRSEVRAAISRCRDAGIRPVMITGDHPETAQAIAYDLGIARPGDRVVIGHELDQLDDAELTAVVEQLPVYARVTAAHKLRIVKAWRARQHVVAMTGDGVNDAPAIKAADVGVAMGLTGTDVTKEVSDLVLTDDNFATIVNAVEEGRTIYDNIHKFVHYLLAANAGEVLLMFGSIVAGWPAPLAAIQLLWINLVTDALPAMALGVEPSEPDVMSRPPRPPKERVITRSRGLQILAHGALNAAAAAIAFYAVYRGRPENVPEARTAAFTTLALAQLMFVLACRSDRYSLFRLGLFSNPWLIGAIGVSAILQLAAVLVPFLQPLFKVAPVSFAWEWVMIAGLSLVPMVIVELTKLVPAGLRAG